MRTGLFGAVPLAHFFLSRFVNSGDTVVDATCGNGFDTLFLARLVGDEGAVVAFDLNEKAVRETASLLSREGMASRVRILNEGHERLAEHVDGPVKAVVFNLGYLPRAGDAPPTLAHTTLAALEQASSLVVGGGIITVCLYTGHGGGGEEAAAVEAWGGALSPALWNVWRSRQVNRSEAAPYLVVAERVAGAR